MRASPTAKTAAGGWRLAGEAVEQRLTAARDAYDNAVPSSPATGLT